MNENELMINVVKEEIKKFEKQGFVLEVAHNEEKSEIVAEFKYNDFKHKSLITMIAASVVINPMVVILLCETLKNMACKINNQLKLGFDDPLKFRIVIRNSKNGNKILFSTYGDDDPHSLKLENLFPIEVEEKDNENF